MGNVQQKGKPDALSHFQRRKLKYEFNTFFDLNKDGILTYSDFLWAKDKICYMSGWKIDSPKYQITEALFKEIWESLEHIADIDKDGKISKAEWLAMWTVYKREIIALEKENQEYLKHYYKHQKAREGAPMTATARMEVEANGEIAVMPDENDEDEPIELDSDEEAPPQRSKEDLILNQQGDVVATETVLEKFASHATNFDDSKLPKWLYKYLVFRFNLLDRTGDNVIDNEEFEYVLSEFGVSPRTARQAFTIFTQNNTVTLDFDTFVELFEEYYLSDDPGALGNFINGKLSYDEGDSDDEDPGALANTDTNVRRGSDASVGSMDDDLKDEMPKTKAMEHEDKEKSRSVIRLHEMAKKCKDDAKRCCAIL